MAHISQFEHTFPDQELAEAAMVALRRLDRMYEARPIAGGLELASAPPECPHQCERCFMACAIIPNRIKWWEAELDRAGGVPLYALRQDGIGKH